MDNPVATSSLVVAASQAARKRQRSITDLSDIAQEEEHPEAGATGSSTADTSSASTTGNNTIINTPGTTPTTQLSTQPTPSTPSTRITLDLKAFPPLPPSSPPSELSNAEAIGKLQRALKNKSSDKRAKAGTNAPFTQAPPGGFPHVHGHDSTHHVDNVRPDFADGWAANDGGILVVHILGENAHDPARGAPLARAVGQAINRRFNTTGTRVVQSVPDEVSPKPWEPPNAFFVSSLTHNAATALIAQRAWFTSTIRFLAYPVYAIPQSYLGGLTGLCNFEDQTDLSFIRAALITLFEKKDNPLGIVINNHLQGFHDGDNAPAWDAARVHDTLSLLNLTRIETLGTKGTARPAANMYLPLNSYDDDLWARIKDATRRVEYAMPMHGIGTFHVGWNCDECHGVDHPTGLCPFSHLDNDVEMTEPAVPRDDRSNKKAKAVFPKPNGQRLPPAHGESNSRKQKVMTTPPRK